MKNPIFSKLFLALWNGLLFVGGVTIAACSFIIAHHAIHELPEEIYDNVTAYTNVFGIVVLVFGIVVAIFAFWGCVAFNCRLGWMMITYLVLLGIFSIAQLVYGILCMAYSKKDKFPVANDKIMSELDNGFEQYCHYNPVPEGGRSIYDAAMEHFVTPLTKVVGNKCAIPPPEMSKELCIETYQNPCKEAVINWLTDKLNPIGIILIIVAVMEFLMFFVGVYFFLRVKDIKKGESKFMSTEMRSW